MKTWTLVQEDEAFVLKNPKGEELVCYAFDGPFQKNSYAIRSTDPTDAHRLLKIEGIGFSKDEALMLAYSYAVKSYHDFSHQDSKLDDQTEFAKKDLEQRLPTSADVPI